MERLSLSELAGRIIFMLIVCVAPLAYGTVDFSWQLVLVALFALAMVVQPPLWPRFPRWFLVLVSVLIIVLVIKEFVPYQLIGQPRWRTIVTEGLNYPLGGVFNPSPATAYYYLLTCLLAVWWVIWVRSLASTKAGTRFVLAVIVVASGLLAVISIIMQQMDMDRIYGLREVAGWQGFGPFPNRNHSANFIAMGAIATAGLMLAGWRSRNKWYGILWTLVCAGLCGAVVASRSRGGLLALSCGLILLAILLVSTSRRRWVAISIGVASALIGAAMFSLYGGSMLARFTDPEQGGNWGVGGRLAIWPDVIRYWLDSPWLGHGLGAFRGTFPFYQQNWLDNTLVIHPESSWLQWLCELGAVPLLLLLAMICGGISWFCHSLTGCQRRELILRGTAAAAVAAFSIHCLLDVPGHRWGTALVALALLGVALAGNRPPGSTPVIKPRHAPISVRLVPAVVCCLMALPLLPPAITWTPLGLERFINTLSREERLNSAHVDRILKSYPLDARLHELAGAMKLEYPQTRESAWTHFAIMSKLMPMAWAVPAQQALISAPYNLDMALVYWGDAVKRSRHRGYSILRMALYSLPDNALTRSYWQAYANQYPEHLLTLAELAPAESQAMLYADWLERRLHANDLYRYEVTSFYRMVVTLQRPEDLVAFIDAQIALAPTDQPGWIRAFAAMGEYQLAWKFLEPYRPASITSDSARAATRLSASRSAYQTEPSNLEAAKNYVLALAASDQEDLAIRELRKIITRNQSAIWFQWKLATMYAEQQNFQQAIAVAPQVENK